MSFTKADGAAIKIVFNSDLLGSPDTPFSTSFVHPTGVLSVCSTYDTTSSKKADNMLDGNPETEWFSASELTPWLKITYQNGMVLRGFKLLLGPSYSISGASIFGSMDGSTWVELKSSLNFPTSAFTAVEFDNDIAYTQYKFQFTSTSWTYMVIRELLVKEPSGNELAFSVACSEYDFIPGGTLSIVNKQVKTVECIDNKTLKLTMNDKERFYNAVGQINVSYDSTIGNLYGRGGPVESFSLSFNPQDLIAKRNPNSEDNVSVGVTASYDNIQIFYIDRKLSENVSVSVSAMSVLTNISDI